MVRPVIFGELRPREGGQGRWHCGPEHRVGVVDPETRGEFGFLFRGVQPGCRKLVRHGSCGQIPPSVTSAGRGDAPPRRPCEARSPRGQRGRAARLSRGHSSHLLAVFPGSPSVFPFPVVLRENVSSILRLVCYEFMR